MCARDLASCTLSTTAFHASVIQQHMTSAILGGRQHDRRQAELDSPLVARLVLQYPVAAAATTPGCIPNSENLWGLLGQFFTGHGPNICPKIVLKCVLGLSYDTDLKSAKIISRFS